MKCMYLWIGRMLSNQIFMKGNKAIVINHRSIILISVVCKAFESIIKEHLISQLLDNNLTCIYLFGFMQGISTTLQLLYVLII